jgi:hypothetical protein
LSGATPQLLVGVYTPPFGESSLGKHVWQDPQTDQYTLDAYLQPIYREIVDKPQRTLKRSMPGHRRMMEGLSEEFLTMVRRERMRLVAGFAIFSNNDGKQEVGMVIPRVAYTRFQNIYREGNRTFDDAPWDTPRVISARLLSFHLGSLQLPPLADVRTALRKNTPPGGGTSRRRRR